MPVRRVNFCQLTLGHIDAPERQRLADELAAEILRKRDQFRLTQLLLKDEIYLGKRSGFWGQRRQHREKLKALQEREAELVAEIRELEEKLCQLGGHPKFRTPVVEGYGLADALRKLRK